MQSLKTAFVTVCGSNWGWNQLMLTAGTERLIFCMTLNFLNHRLKILHHGDTTWLGKPRENWPLGHTQEFQMECETNLELLLSFARL